MTIPKIRPKPIPRLFLRYQIFRNRDFFPRPNFSKIETDTFLPRPNFPKPRLFSETNVFRNRNRDFFPKPNFTKPKPRLFSETKFFRNRNQDFFSETKFSETETLKDLAKVWKPRSFKTEMSISA